jgi:2,3-bisphosphoglycerate-independent phosphoglycerate mutase
VPLVVNYQGGDLMDMHQLTRQLKESATSKIVLVVADGLGGLPATFDEATGQVTGPNPGGKTELETARTPNLDALARRGVCGLSTPVAPGITPGSGPGHLGLFGYDPLRYDIGRGVLEALGIDFGVGPNDVAIRGNFCTVDRGGNVTDRRAGRIATEKCVALCDKLRRQVRIPGIELFIEPVREYRLVIVFRGAGLGDLVEDTDPQAIGVPTLDPIATDRESSRTVEVAKEFLNQARAVLAGESPANMVMLRGFAKLPAIAPMKEVYGIDAVALAVYPMYRGLAKLVGMRIADAGKSLTDQVAALRREWMSGDFFFLHYKYTDSTGEDGNFAAKVARIEELDAAMSGISDLNPDVLLVTGDHSTPSLLKSHSWHPVPTLIVAKTCRPDASQSFGEGECSRGGLGQFLAKDLLPMALAHAGRLGKYGA